MKSVEFNNEELQQMRTFYENELNELVYKFEHVKGILEKLGLDVDVTLPYSKRVSNDNQPYAKEPVIKSRLKAHKEEKKKKIHVKMLNRMNEIKRMADIDEEVKEYLDIMNDDSIPVIEFKNTKSEKRSSSNEPVSEIIIDNYRRNKNILWSDYVYDVIGIVGYPLTVEELRDRSINELKLSEVEQAASFSAIHSALFRLKRNQKSVNNYALKGSRTSYYGLANWYTKEGKLLKKFTRSI